MLSQLNTLASLLESGSPVLVRPTGTRRACASSLTPWPVCASGKPQALYAVALHHRQKNCAFVLMPRPGTITRHVGLFRLDEIGEVESAAHEKPERPTSQEMTQISRMREATEAFERILSAPRGAEAA